MVLVSLVPCEILLCNVFGFLVLIFEPFFVCVCFDFCPRCCCTRQGWRSFILGLPDNLDTSNLHDNNRREFFVSYLTILAGCCATPAKKNVKNASVVCFLYFTISSHWNCFYLFNSILSSDVQFVKPWCFTGLCHVFIPAVVGKNEFTKLTLKSLMSPDLIPLHHTSEVQTWVTSLHHAHIGLLEFPVWVTN